MVAKSRDEWGNRPLRIEAAELVRNEAGLRRLCAWLGITPKKHKWEMAYAYLRWLKKNPQPRADRR